MALYLHSVPPGASLGDSQPDTSQRAVSSVDYAVPKMQIKLHIGGKPILYHLR